MAVHHLQDFVCAQVKHKRNLIKRPHHHLPLSSEALNVIVAVDAGPVLCARVAALPVERGGINQVPENREQLIIGHRTGVVGNLERCRNGKMVKITEML
jgi:hypothetical protein